MIHSPWNRSGRGGVLGLSSWKLGIVLVLALALGIAITLVAAGLFLIALPVVAVVVLAYRLFGGKRRGPPPAGTVVEGEYEVIGAKPAQPDGGSRR